jgi:hypothetical protein
MSDTLAPLDPGIRLETARNLRIQSLEALHAALDDWRDAEGTGAYRLMCGRFVLRCVKDFRWYDALYMQRWRETIGNRRAA